MEEAALAAEGKYGSLQEAAAAKTRKLEKLQQRIAVRGRSFGRLGLARGGLTA
jgi:hypothetical protein